MSRPATPVVYANDEPFAIGKAKILRKSDNDQVLVVAAGVTLHEALKAADKLAEAGVNIRVMDPFTIKPLDEEAIIKNARECGGKIVAVEDHFPEGGLCGAVAKVAARHCDIMLRSLSINEMPTSGPPRLLIEKYAIGANSIVNAVLAWQAIQDTKASTVPREVSKFSTLSDDLSRQMRSCMKM